MDVWRGGGKDLCGSQVGLIGCERELFVEVDRYAIACPFLPASASLDLLLGLRTGNSMGLILDARGSHTFFKGPLGGFILMPALCRSSRTRSHTFR